MAELPNDWELQVKNHKVAAMVLAFVSMTSFSLAAAGTVGAQQGDPGKPDREFVPGRLIVKLEDQATTEDLDRANRSNGASTEEKVPRTRLAVVDLPAGLPVEEAIARYEASPDVEYAQPDFLYTASATTPNDPSYSKLWGLNNTGQTGGTSDADADAPEAWDVTTGGPDTVVAVIDEGVDVSHPDLRDNIWTNPDEVAGNRIDDDRNGYVDDVNGWDFVHNDASVYDAADGDKHGTHVAGTIAAEGNNGIGVAGASWNAKIMPLKFLGPTSGSTSGAVKAINYALAEGVKISNNSYGGAGADPALLEAIKKADAAGHLVVAAAGNDGANNDVTASYPANYNVPNVVSVAATDSNDALATFSNYGATSVDLAAPGVSILSTLPGNTYGSYSGTSMATPHVAGTAALIKSEYPTADDAEMKTRLLESVDQKVSLVGKTATGGRLNAAGALKPAPSSITEATPTPPTGDIEAPTVTTISPSGGATGTRRAANVTAAFSEEMDAATLTGQTVTLKRVSTGSTVTATVRCDNPCRTVTLDPSTSLASRTKYEARIFGGPGGPGDKAGNRLAADKVWTFTTGRR